ncbi:tyrosine-type recombinase/integrase [Christensenellaceae bacterium OttesenSCG-928-K19]|nr:tyrosine-type recombinase/integrase [Christensenellaceae bacterium OttesenSCG-928-K19]
MDAKALLKEFLLECEIRKFSPKTLKGYRDSNLYLLNYLEAEHQITLAEDISHIHIKRFLTFLQKNGRKATYTNGLIKTFRSFFKYLKEEEYISINPMLKIKWGKQEKPIIKTFSKREVAKMVKAFGGSNFLEIRNKAIIATLFDTGIRCSELCDLKADAIKDTYINVWGKGNKERSVGKSPYLEKFLLRYTIVRDAYFRHKLILPENLFLSRTGKPLTVEAVERVVKIAGEYANVAEDIRCSPHTCRHWYAQAQLKNGLDVYSLSRLLGHNNVRITQVYLDSMKDKDIVEKSVLTSPLMNL